MIFWLISRSYVQNRIFQELSESFTEFTNQKIQFNYIKFQWDGTLEFKNFYLEDHHQDTLLYIHTLKTSLINFRRIQKKKFELTNLNATGVYLNLKKYEGDETHTLKVLLEKLKKETSSKRKALFKIEDINLEEVSFRYEDKNNVKSKPLLINSLSIEAKSLNFKDNFLELELQNLEGIVQLNSAKPIKTKAFIHYEPGFLHLEDWQLVSEKNDLKGSLKLVGANKRLRNFKADGQIEMQVISSHWDISSFLASNHNINNIPLLEASFNINGLLSELNINKLKISNSLLDFKGKITAKNLFENNAPSLKVTTNDLVINTQKLEQLNIIPIEFKAQLTQLTQLRLQGIANIDKDIIDFDFNSNNIWGSFSLKGNLGKGILDKSEYNKSFYFESIITNFELSRWMAKNKNLRMEAKVFAFGDISDINRPKLFWTFNNVSLSSKKLNLDGIKFEGRIEESQLRNTLSINSNLIELKSDFLYNYNYKLPETTILANINKWDLTAAGFGLGSGKSIFKGVILSNFKGLNLNDLEGEIKISSATIENESKIVDLNPILIKKEFIGNETLLEIINNDCISGKAKGPFKTSELGALFQNTFHQVYPFLPQKKVSNSQEVSFKLKINKKLLDALYPNFSISENIKLNGKIYSDKFGGQINLDAPLLKYKDIQFQKMHFQVDANNSLFNTYLNVENVSHQYYEGNNFNLISMQLRDTLYFRSEFDLITKSKTPFEINFYYTRDKQGASHFGFKKSIIPIGTDSWTVNPKNQKNQKISYFPGKQKTNLSILEAVSGNQSISLSGNYINKDFYALKLDLKNILLENILPPIPSFKIAGETQIKANIARSSSENEFNVKAKIEKMKINDQKLGDFSLSSTGNTKTNSYFTDLYLKKQDEKNVQIKGLWQGLKAPRLNFKIDINDLDISFLSPLGKNALNRIHGKLGGEVNLWGSLDALNHNGYLAWSKGGFSVPFLNLDYKVETTKIDLKNQNLFFKSVKINDTNEGTSAIMSGSFFHSNFNNWMADLTISSDRMLLLNTKQEPESLFFGQGYLDGDVQLEGPTKNLKILLQGKTEKGTSIKIPWSESYGLSDTSFVNFINKKGKERFENKIDTRRIDDVKGLELGFELDVNNNASIEIVIDQETGSYLSGRGEGNLLMEINTKGKFNMWGDFITNDGIYNFKNLGVINKKFDLKPGGTIIWEGDPLEAQMDLEAVYEVPGGANPALLLDNPNFNKNIPTEVLIRLQGNLLKPDDPIFEIGFPNTSGNVASEINYRLADPQRSQLQAISLLSQGIFINEVSVSMQGITNNLYQKASDIVSNLIGEKDDKLKVGIDYLQGDKSALLDIATEDRLGFTLSTQISDKILLNGKIGVPVGGLEQTLIVGNVQIDFILNDEGSLRAKVFNKENEFRYIGDELGYTQGVGLSYNVDFNTFKQLINKITSQKEFSEQDKDLIQNSENNNLIEFIKKN